MTGHLKHNLFVLTALQSGLRQAVQVLFGPKIGPKSDFSRFTFINPPFRSQSDPTQCDHKSCIISYGIAWYCIVGFGVRAVSHKTPIYFIKWHF